MIPEGGHLNLLRYREYNPELGKHEGLDAMKWSMPNDAVAAIRACQFHEPAGCQYLAMRKGL